MEIKKSDFVKSAVVEANYPEPINSIEFAFVGRSNVGKSSLINSLTNRRKLARISKTPGRTQLINYFIINDTIYLVDLPGYGFAKVPKVVKDAWGKTVEKYLTSQRSKFIFLLLDIRRVPNSEDLELVKWLGYYKVPFKLIFTKVDKMSNNQKYKQLKNIKKVLNFKNNEVLFYSSLSHIGREILIDNIEKILTKQQN